MANIQVPAETPAPTRSDMEYTRQVRQYVPDVDIYENEDALVLVANVPGVKPEGLNITLENNVLTIHGQVALPEVGERKLVRAEYEPGDYHRSFTLSESIDQAKIDASLKDGVLTLRLPKAEQAKARKIQVKSS